MIYRLQDLGTVILVALFICLGAVTGVFGQEEYVGAFDELAGKSKVVLIITKSVVVDAKEPERALVESALKMDRPRPSYAFFFLAKPLNDYIKKTRRMTPVRKIAEAEYIIYFSLLEYRRILDARYPYGDLYVILKTRKGDKQSGRIVWRTEKSAFAEDAVKKLLRAFKALHEKK